MAPPSAAESDITREVRASRAQEMRWRGSRFDVLNCVYRLRGPLDSGAIRAALEAVMARHEALRSSLHRAGQLMMRVHAEVPTPLSCIDAEGRTQAEREAWLAAWIDEEIRRPFDRGRPPLVRATLIRLGETDHAFVIVIDHIISDGWSVQLLAQELGIAYAEAIDERGAPPVDVTQYADWVTRERAMLTEQHLAAREAFWRSQFPNGPQDLGVWLPGYQGLDEGAARSVALIETALGEKVTDGLREAARRSRVTLFSLTATVLIRLLQRDTGQQRITISTSSASRFNAESASVIGYLASTVWIPTSLPRGSDIATVAQVFQQNLLEMISKADVPARAMFERLWGPDARSLTDAVPQVDFLCTPDWGESLALPGVDVETTEIHDGTADGALTVFLTDRGSIIELQVGALPGASEEGYAEALADRYVAELEEVAGLLG